MENNIFEKIRQENQKGADEAYTLTGLSLRITTLADMCRFISNNCYSLTDPEEVSAIYSALSCISRELDTCSAIVQILDETAESSNFECIPTAGKRI